MPVPIRRHRDRGVTEAGLHKLERQFESAVDSAIDAPADVEVPESVQARILRLPALVTTPAAICAGCRPRRTMFRWLWTRPVRLANTRSSGPLGQARRAHAASRPQGEAAARCARRPRTSGVRWR